MDLPTGHGIKNTPETRFRIASVGKLFTATAILQLIEAGKLTLETRVLDCLGMEGTKIPPDTTVYHMLTITSGIADWSNEESDNYLGFQWRYGLGCYVLLDGAGQTIRLGHTGEEDGVSCRVWHYPQQDVDVVILGNQSSCAGKVSWEVQDFAINL
jgi:hypothetical protein